jgi:MerR family mercuric resistance operon transcriptional regulator
MRIGELARKAQVNLQSIRFYERQKLLRVPARTTGGYRVYEQRDLEHLLFIKWCQRLGFSLREVRELLPLHACLMGKPAKRGQWELRAIVGMIEQKLANLDSQIAALQAMSQQVNAALKQLKQSAAVCPAAKSKVPAAGPG